MNSLAIIQGDGTWRPAQYEAGSEDKFSGRLRAEDYFVDDIDISRARSFIEANHYARGASNTRVFTHGLFKKGEAGLLGVAWWIPPTRIACESVNKDHWRKVLSLSRLAIAPGVPKNAASFLLARSVKRIKLDGRFVSLVTYADEGQGHTGLIYRAANWQFVGRGRPEATWATADGRLVSKKSGPKTRTPDEMNAAGFVLTGKFSRLKFVLHIGEVA